MMKSFQISILGRPNVGKSSLFNVLVGKHRSIVLDDPGTTVDTIREKVNWGCGTIELLDSEGIWIEENGSLQKVTLSADAILFIVDAKSGPTPYDKILAQKIRATLRPVLLCINKSETKALDYSAFYELGMGDPVPTSSLHRTGIENIKNWCLAEQAKRDNGKSAAEQPIVLQLAIVGRPNTGKSTLMNWLCGDLISRVSTMPLTTRDTVSYELKTDRGVIQILDTAGIRKHSKGAPLLERLSIRSAQDAIRRADVVFLMIDSHEPLTFQDRRLINWVAEAKKPVAFLFNFWDKLDAKSRHLFLRERREEFSSLFRSYSVLPISALRGTHLSQCIPLAFVLFDKSQKRISTAGLNQIVQKILVKNPPPSGFTHFNILYASQVKTNPPTFVFFMNRKEKLPLEYKRYLANQLRSRLGLKSQPIQLHFRQK